MGVSILSVHRPDGSRRAIWTDAVAQSFREAGCIPRRASRVEVIEDGPRRGQFHVDFSLLAEHLRRPEFQVCLVKTFDSYSAAVQAEVAWLQIHFLLEVP